MAYHTALKARFYDRAERLYVEDGLSPQAIRKAFIGQLVEEGTSKPEAEDEVPSRRTLYNWMTDGGWRDARRRFLRETEDIRLTMREAVRAAAEEAIVNPNRDTFSALRNAVSGAKMWEQLQGLERAAENVADADDRESGDVARDALEIVKQALEGR